MDWADAYVLDASVAVKWHLPDEDLLVPAWQLVRQFGRGEFALFAPEQIRYEVPNAIPVAVQRRPARLTTEEGQSAVAEFLSLQITTFSDTALLTDAYSFALQYGCAFYDAFYLALALRTNRPLVTADRRPYQHIGSLPLVIWLGNWPADATGR
ncbi:MAG: type II toxin-antitoxin system VapC family toxin [Dehalococcoidia bacterium]